MNITSATMARTDLATLYRRFTLLSLLAVAFCLLTTSPVFANGMGIVICNVVLIIYGQVGRGLATLAIIVLGIGATLGKVSWGLAITVAVGVAVIFNAGSLVYLLTSGAISGVTGSAC